MSENRRYSRQEALLCELSRSEGEKLLEKEKYKKALQCFHEALRHIPDDIQCFICRSKCYAKLGRIRRAAEEVDMALELDSSNKSALLQKATLLDQTGNHEMALVYYHRGSKFYPKSQHFKDGIKRAEKHTQRRGARKMKLTPAGDISMFTKLRKPAQQKSFQWKNKPKEPDSRMIVPSASFKNRLVHPLVKIERTPSIHLNESRASVNSLLAGSLHSLAYEDSLIKETSDRESLGKLYNDKEYLEFLLGFEDHKNKRTPLGPGDVGKTAEHGLSFLEERSHFWNSLGPLPPPHPSRTSQLSRNRLGRDRSRMSHYTSMESLNSVDTFKSGSSNQSKSTSKKAYKSRYAYGRPRDKPVPPAPEKVNFDFSTYKRDPDVIREMTKIMEEEAAAMDSSKTSQEAQEKQKEDMKKRGEEITEFVNKELVEIEKLYKKGNISTCKKRADNCIDMLGRYTDDEVVTKNELLSGLYSCLGNCDMVMQNYDSALENHGHDLIIGEESDNMSIQSRALGNIGRVHVITGKYNRALDVYNRKAPMCRTAEETAWLFHEIGNCFLHLKIFQYAHESGLKALKSASETDDKRLLLQTNVLTAVSEVNLMKYKDAYHHFEAALDLAKVLDDKKVQDAMTRALVDVNKKMVTQMKSKKKQTGLSRKKSPVRYNVSSRATTHSARTDVTVEG